MTEGDREKRNRDTYRGRITRIRGTGLEIKKRGLPSAWAAGGDRPSNTWRKIEKTKRNKQGKPQRDTPNGGV